jgi:hypothetical protein
MGNGKCHIMSNTVHQAFYNQSHPTFFPFNLFVLTLFRLILRSVFLCSVPFCVQSHFFLRSDPFYISSLNSFYVEKQIFKFHTNFLKHFIIFLGKKAYRNLYDCQSEKLFFAKIPTKKKYFNIR